LFHGRKKSPGWWRAWHGYTFPLEKRLEKV